ncbi:MAG: restriction endonuclease subunit S, partial [Anaeroplasmataceae bacterium]|nr:restriction endonuclease subunit S [Anaeroplasmataceae bacterium]
MKTIKNLKAEELRKSILQLAIQGKLVKQDPNDEPASELVKRIYEEKNKLISEGKIKKEKNQSYIFKGDDNCYYEKIGSNAPIMLKELPFDIPDNWMFIKLESLTFPVGSKANQISSKSVLKKGQWPVVSQSQKIIDGYSNENEKVISIKSESPIIMFGDHTRNVKIIDFSFIIGADGTKFFKPLLIDEKYLFFLISYVAGNLKNRGYARHYSLLKQELLPLPPLNEQLRIVSKIKSFEPLIDKYDELEKKLTSLELEFPEKFKKSILQYAIEGKLVKQDPNDEPASVLLERIKTEKEKLIKEGKIKQDKNESYIYQGDDKNYYEK